MLLAGIQRNSDGPPIKAFGRDGVWNAPRLISAAIFKGEHEGHEEIRICVGTAFKRSSCSCFENWFLLRDRSKYDSSHLGCSQSFSKKPVFSISFKKRRSIRSCALICLARG